MTNTVTVQEAPAQATAGHSDTGRTLRLLARFARGQRRSFALAFGLLAFEAMTAVLEAYPLAYMIDYFQGSRGGLTVPGIESERVGTIAVLTVAIVALAAVNSAADSMAEIQMAKGGRTLGYSLRVSLFSHLQRLSLAFHDRRRTGDVITRVTGDVREVEEFVIKSGSDLAGSALLLTGTLTFLAFHSWQVTLVALAIVPVLALISHWFSKRIKAAARQQRAREGDVASSTQEMLTAIRVVQTFGRASYDEERFAVQSSAAMDAAFEAARLQAWFSWATAVFQAVSIAVVVWMGLWLIDRGAITVGTLVLFVILISNMFKPTRRIIKEWTTLAKLYASVERIADLLDRRPSVRDEPGAVRAPRLRGAVEFRGVGFSYEVEAEDLVGAPGAGERRAALRGVSFQIAPGEVVALVGHSGAGKTTVAQLLPRLYDPQEGVVLIDGHDVRSFKLESLRSQISMVLQETILFSGTVAENIAYGRMGATREEIVDAARHANADEFIRQLPDGYDTDLTERAGNLSGGQRQRLAIARAFVRDTPLLILDEPTTGLDAESSGLVLAALRTLMRGKTTLIISHDFRLIRWADRILVLREGRVAQAGTHDALLEEGGVYEDLFARQLDLDGAVQVQTNGADGNGQSSDGAEAVVAALEVTATRSKKQRDADARRSPALRRELPDLEIALDETAMGERLQTALVDGANRIERCRVGKALYLPGEGCMLRYELDIAGAPESPYLVGARLFADGATGADLLRTKLLHLARQAEGRAELAPFASPVAARNGLPMVVYAFPIDPELPMLVGATDPQRIIPLFHFEDEESGGRVPVDSCRVGLAHYPRRTRCVLRYELAGTLGSGEEVHRTVYGRVTGDPPRMSTAARELREWSQLVFPDRFVVPRVLGIRPKLGLAFTDEVPGAPLIAQLVTSRMGAEPPPETTLTLEEAIEACADIAALLHSAGLRGSSARTLDDELGALRPTVSAMRRISPGLGAQLTDTLELLETEAVEVSPLPSVFCHGDYTPAQVVYAGGKSGLLDLETLCTAEAALDLGNFTAYLRLLCRKAERGSSSPRSALGADLCGRFLDSYMAAAGTPARDEDRLLARTRAYEAASLVRIAVHSWQQLKPKRTADALSILEEQASLPAPTR